MSPRKLIKEKTRNEEWSEIKNEPNYLYGLLAKRWKWTVLWGIVLIIFIIILLKIITS